MSVDDRDKRTEPDFAKQSSEKEEISAELQSDSDEPLSPRAEAAAERDAASPQPITPQGRRRRLLTRRNAIIVTIAASVAVVALILVMVIVYRLGFVDNYIAGQVIDTFAKYGIRAEIKEFHTTITPQTVEMLGLELYDAQTGERLGKIDRLLATVRIEDLYALSLERNINLKDLKIEGFEAWVTFDEQGRSNFRNIHIPPPDPNRRILFAYSTAHVEITNGVIHYGDERHEISGEARNIQATIEPDDPNAPADSWMNKFALSLSDSTFTYDGRPVNDIDIQARGRANQTRAEITELVLRSPVAEARLQGTMDDWRALRYQMSISSTVDLTQLSDVLQPGAALRGAGNFVGTVTGEGDNFKVEGQIKSDALAADGVRLRGLTVTASGSGQGRRYNANGRAVAELLSAGDFQLSNLQLAGNVMGTGSDFRWIGELRAAAARAYGTSIAGLILQDAVAELNDGVLTASSSQLRASGVTSSGTRVNGVTASNIRVRNENDVTSGTIAAVKAGTIAASGARVDGVTANQIDIASRGGTTSVVVREVVVGATNAGGAEIGSINIAGVRLSVRDGRIEGSTADIDAGTVKLADGQAENVKLAGPTFVVEPSGRYRASADLSIGGGVLGRMDLGQVQARLVASSSEIQLSDFRADIFEGQASGDARIALTPRGSSRIVADFSNLDVAGPLTAFAGAAVPLAGRASGSINLTFPGSDFEQASGTLSSRLTAEPVETGSELVPINGTVALQADRGLFQIQQVELQTAATTLRASGQFSFSGDSNLTIDLNSSDVGELQAVLIDSGLLPDVEDQIDAYKIGLSGQLAFNGTLRGNLISPDIDGRVSLGSLSVRGNDLGAFSASIVTTPDALKITDGRLVERDGGGIQFAVNAPRAGQNNISLTATLDRANGAALLAAFPLSRITPDQIGDTQADVSGKIEIAGIPDAMNGSAELRFGPGRLAGEPLESLVARATFSGSDVRIESVDARLTAGHIIASGSFNVATQEIDLEGRAERIQLSRLAVLAGTGRGLVITGTADFAGRIKGSLAVKDFSEYLITFDGKGHNVTINGREAGTLSLVGRTENRQLNVTLTTGLLGADQVITAQVNLADESLPATIETNLNNAELANLFPIILPQSTVRITGRATGSLKASGPLFSDDDGLSISGLQGAANLSELTFRVEDVQLTATSPLLVRFSPREIFFEKTQFTGPGTNISLGGTLAVGPGGKQSMTADGQLNLRVLNGLSPDVFTSGIADVAVRIIGSYEDPRLNGTASVAGGSISILLGNERWSISNLKSVIRFTADQAQIESFAGVMGGGRVSASGGARLERFALAEFLVNLRGENVTIPFPEEFRSTIDADVEIKGSAREQLIGGTVSLKRTEYTEDIELADLINTRREQSIEEGGEIEFTRAAIFNDLRVEGRNALVVRNNLADLVGSVSLQLNGPVQDPVISGRITATSGTLNFRNDRYEITRALVDLPARQNADPILNIHAESQIRGYRVMVSLTGPLSQPQALVSSEPALPQADIVALITTGQLATGDESASALAQSSLGTATSLLTDALINAPAQRATSKLFGLTRFEINPVIGGRTGSTPAARLTLGRRINKNLSVTYSTNVASDPNQILAFEYRVSDRLSFIAQYEQAPTRRLTSRTDAFSFEIRFRKRF